jgi:hypothetical protein
VEKSCKSYGYRFGVIDEREGKEGISHYGTRVFKKIVQYSRSNTRFMKKQFYKLSQVHPELVDNDGYKAIMGGFSKEEENDNQLIKFLVEVESHRGEIANMSYDNLCESINKLEEGLKQLEETQAKFDKSYEEFLKNMEEKMSEVEVPDRDIRIDYSDVVLAKDEEIMENMSKVDGWFFLNLFISYRALYPLLVLALITQSHYQDTKYPSGDKTPDDIYTAEHPLIRLYERIHSICAYSTNALDDIFAEMDSEESND